MHLLLLHMWGSQQAEAEASLQESGCWDPELVPHLNGSESQSLPKPKAEELPAQIQVILTLLEACPVRSLGCLDTVDGLQGAMGEK